jgi:hypothetical protein
MKFWHTQSLYFTVAHGKLIKIHKWTKYIFYLFISFQGIILVHDLKNRKSEGNLKQ